MDRREFLTSVGALSALSVLPVSFSQAAELTKKYSGTTLRVMLGAGGGAFDVYKKMTEAFTEQTGITFDYTTLPDADYYSKIVLDVTTGTNAFDAYLYTYFWKGELAAGFADLEKLVPTIESAPALGLDDYPGQVVEVYGRSNGKLIGLPVLGDATMFVWNKAQYKDVGLDPNAPPKSWEEVVANGQKLKAGRQERLRSAGGQGLSGRLPLDDPLRQVRWRVFRPELCAAVHLRCRPQGDQVHGRPASAAGAHGQSDLGLL